MINHSNNFEWDITRFYAYKIWNKNVEKIDNDIHETNNHPMHPDVFFSLSNVSGFNKCNGYNYYEYVLNWNKRNHATYK